MLINISKIKKGLYIEIKKKIFKVFYFKHVNPGKGHSFIRTKLKNINNNNIIKLTFLSSQKLKLIKIISKHYIFLFKKKNKFLFINKNNFNQIYLSKKLVGNKKYFLKENSSVIIDFLNNIIPVYLHIKNYVLLKVIETAKELKGNNKKRNYKKSILETGLKINTPLFIKKGNIIKINTKKKIYIERIKQK